MKKNKDKLVLLGCLDTFRDAPFNDDTFEIWGMGTLWHKMTDEELNRIDRWFEIHTLNTRTEIHLEWLKNYEKEIIMQERFKEIPMAVKYPLDAIINKFSSKYFLCTFSYMIALAMHMKYKEIHFYGVNMIMNDDLIQKWSMEYWVGRAEQSGIKIVIPDDCDLLKCGALYGYEANNTLAVYIGRYLNEMKTQINNNIKSSIESLIEAEKKIDIIENHQTKFMQEILNRHKINYIIDDEVEL